MVILLSQPPLNIREATAHDSADRGSAFAITAAMLVALLSASLQFAVAPAAPAGWLLVVGGLLGSLGLALRLWAISTLGRLFTSTVFVVDEQPLVVVGPYRVLRHPSYTGALLAMLGVTFALASPIGVALLLGLGVPAYLYRISIEERALVRNMGAEYESYRRRTWALVPLTMRRARRRAQ
jgi:protein-S-isoprenylcysteine O-methyltransferase